ncbi:MAG: HEAT repeat domain-containing protein, partial [Gemmatimonadetes bacterium]|nr:HEAT repeat domain-containing protein [Gemmatimonadota bacterium]
KAILDISYAAIDDTRREELHEELGQYQERLFEQGLLSSASILAYHFRRSANQAKARHYEQTQRAYTESVFDRGEIALYTDRDDPREVAAYTDEDDPREVAASVEEVVPEEIEAGAPLDADTVALVPQALRMILSAMRNIQLYPPESMAIARAMEQAMEALGAILVRTGRLTLTYAEGALIANGEPLDLSEYSVLETSVLDLLREAELRAVSLTRDVTVDEVRGLLLTMGTVVPGAIARDFWSQVSRKEGFRSLEVRQAHYTRVDPSAGVARKSRDKEALSPPEMAAIPDLIRDFIKTASDVRLYPLGSERVSASISALLTSLQRILNDRPSLSLARVENLVLVNGERADVTQWESVADAFISLLDTLGLLSITFFSSLSREDLDTFFGQLRDQGSARPEPGFWETYASDKGVSGIAFNMEAYAPEMIEALLASALRGQAPQPVPPPAAVADDDGGAEIAEWDLDDDGEAEIVEWGLDEDGETDLDMERDPGERSEVDLDTELDGEVDVDESVVRVAKELLLEGKNEEVRDLMSRVFFGYEHADVEHRTTTVTTCRQIFHQLVIGLQHQFTELTLDTLTAAVGTESEPSVLAEASALLFEMAAAAIRFSDYRLAARLYALVEIRRSDLRAQGEAPGSPYAVLLDVEIDPHTCQLLIEDLRSGQTERQARASLAVGHMGVTAVELLIDVIKQERDLRVRQLAAGLLGELEGGAAEQLKETLLTEVLVEHRYRALEVVDLVTKDLRMELAFNIGDENPKIRRAAFQLFERLGQDDLVPLMVPAARADDPAVAKGALRSLATVGTPSAVGAIIELLRETESPILATACCQALGTLKAEGGVDVLGEALSRQDRTGEFHWEEEVRATAAVALRQIGTPRGEAILGEHKGDASMRIREVAQPRKAETEP